MYTIYVSDTETTGTDPVKNDIIELSLGRLLLLPGEIVRDQKTWYMQPKNLQNIEDEALKVNGYKREDLLHRTEFGKLTFRPIEEVLPKIEQWIDEDNVSVYDRLLVGHNVDFDARFKYNTWIKGNSKDTFPFEMTSNNGELNFNRSLDTKNVITFIDLCTGKRRKYYNLTSCIKSFGVKKGKAHKAEEDVRMTMDLLLATILPIKDTVAKAFMNCYDE